MFSDLRDGLGQVLLTEGVSPAEVTTEQIEAAVAKVQEAKDAGQIRRFTGNDYGDDLVAGQRGHRPGLLRRRRPAEAGQPGPRVRASPRRG